MRIQSLRGVTRGQGQARTSRGNSPLVSALRLHKPRHLIAVAALLAGVLVPLGGVVMTSGPAGATACGSPVNAGSNCTSTGTLTLTGGNLSLTAPSTLGWSSTITGVDLSLYDPTAADQGYTVSDDTGTGAGWHVTLSATTFANGTHYLPDATTFSTNGGTTSATASTAPTALCVASSNCTLPTNTTTYPVAVTTALTSPTAVTVYDTSANTGMGNIQIGGTGATNVVGWWLKVPASAYAGAYTSTLTFSVISAP